MIQNDRWLKTIRFLQTSMSVMTMIWLAVSLLLFPGFDFHGGFAVRMIAVFIYLTPLCLSFILPNFLIENNTFKAVMAKYIIKFLLALAVLIFVFGFALHMNHMEFSYYLLTIGLLVILACTLFIFEMYYAL